MKIAIEKLINKYAEKLKSAKKVLEEKDSKVKHRRKVCIDSKVNYRIDQIYILKKIECVSQGNYVKALEEMIDELKGLLNN